MPPTITFFVVLTEVVKEKEERLRLALRMMGMRTLMFWLSWLLYGAAFVSMSTLVLMVSGWAAGMDFFTNSDPAVVYVLFLCFGLAMVMLAFLLSTLISSQKTAQTVGYSFILCGFVLQTIICSAYGGLIDLLFMPDVAPWVRWVKWCLQFYPPFNFSKAYYDGEGLATASCRAMRLHSRAARILCVRRAHRCCPRSSRVDRHCFVASQCHARRASPHTRCSV